MAVPRVWAWAEQLAVFFLPLLVHFASATNTGIHAPFARSLDAETSQLLGQMLSKQFSDGALFDMAACEYNLSKIAVSSLYSLATPSDRTDIASMPVLFNAGLGNASAFARDGVDDLTAGVHGGFVGRVDQQEWAASVDHFLVHSREESRRQAQKRWRAAKDSGSVKVMGTRALRPVSLSFHEHDVGRTLEASAVKQPETPVSSELVTSLAPWLAQLA